MPRSALFAAAALVLLLHGVLAWLDGHPAPREPVGDELRYLAKAGQIARGEPLAADLLWPPLYPHLLAAGLALGGRAAVVLAQTLLLGGVAWIFRDLARRLAGPGPGADAVALLILGYPPLAAYAHYFWPEVVHLSLVAAAVWILAARRDRSAWLAGLGGVLGLALLTKSLLLGFLPVLLGAVLWGKPWRRALAHAGLVALALGAVVLPAVVENGRRTGAWVIADSSRFNLWLGLTGEGLRERTDREVGEAYREYLASAPTYGERNRILDRRIRTLVAERGPGAVLGGQLRKQYARLFHWDSALTDQLPGGVLALRGRGYQGAPRWLATVLRGGSYGLYAILLLGAPAGLALHPPRHRLWVWVLLAFVAYHLLLFLGLHATSRYAVPLLPVLALFSGLALGAGLAPARAGRSGG